MGLPLPQARGPPIFSIFSNIINFFCYSNNRKLSSQQKELITQFARTENLTSGTVNGVSFEQEEGQWIHYICNN